MCQLNLQFTKVTKSNCLLFDIIMKHHFIKQSKCRVLVTTGEGPKKKHSFLYSFMLTGLLQIYGVPPISKLSKGG